jgi:hypothetical protein
LADFSIRANRFKSVPMFVPPGSKVLRDMSTCSSHVLGAIRS